LEFLAEYSLFLAKALTIIIVIIVVISIIASINEKGKKSDKGHIEVTQLNDFINDMHASVQQEVLTSDQNKAEKKRRKKADKDLAKSIKQGETEPRKRVFVLNFKGNIQASESSELRESITAVLAETNQKDEIVLNLESSGGAVHGYGLAASQLDRIRKRHIPLTICVDKVAASGGYMMACVGDKILSAPFAMIGSIGVVGQLPNFNKLLKKHDVEFEQHTAGEYKRTLTMFAKNTKEDREKFRKDIQEIHDQFKNYVAERRPRLNIDEVATGEVWLGTRAKELGLVDDVLTSDEYLTSQLAHADLFEVSFVQKKSIKEKLGLAVEEGLDRAVSGMIQRLSNNRFFS